MVVVWREAGGADGRRASWSAASEVDKGTVPGVCPGYNSLIWGDIRKSGRELIEFLSLRFGGKYKWR